MSLTRRALLGALTTITAPPAVLGAQTLPKVVTHKFPSCGRRGAWAYHLRSAGFPIEVVEVADINRVKVRLGVPLALAFCHTAEVAATSSEVMSLQRR